MKKSVNKVILLGNVCKDASPINNNASSFNLATNNSYKDKTTGEFKTITEFHRLVCFGKTAEIAASYVKKGALLYIEGSLKNSKYTGKDGTEKQITSVIVNELLFLSPKKEEKENNSETNVATKEIEYDSDIPF